MEKTKNEINENTLAARLVIPMAIVFLSICLSSSLILSSFIISKSIDNSAKNNISNTTSSNTAATPTQTPVAVSIDQVKSIFNTDHIKFGDSSKKVLFVEFSDPSCPYCHVAGGKDPELNAQVGSNFKLVSQGGTYVAPMDEIRKLVDSGQASFAWVYYPGHGNGEIGTQALYCANEKGKFWDVHDLLMSNAGYNLLNNQVQNDKTKSGLVSDFLKSVIDSTQMKSCIDSGKYFPKLATDQSLASSFGVTGTPGFFINNTSYAGAYSYTEMKSTVDNYLKA